MSRSGLIEPFSVSARAIPTRLVTTTRVAAATERCLLDGCENDEVSAAALRAVREASADHLLLHWDSQDESLRADLAQTYGVDTGQVFLTAGAMDAIRTAFDVFGPAASSVGLLEPDWPGFAYFAERSGAQIQTLRRPDFPHQFDVDSVATFCASSEIDLVIVSNPSAVTGRMWHRDEVARLLTAAPDTMFIIDEADAIYPTLSSIALIHEHPNAVFLGSLSKFLGLSGLRIGFIVTPERSRIAFANTIDRIGLASVALVAGRAALADLEYQAQTQRITTANLAMLRAALEGTPFRIAPASECFACYLSADDTIEDPFELLAAEGVDLVPGSLFGLARGGRLNLRSTAKVRTCIDTIKRITQARHDLDAADVAMA
ncbi:MAG: aminotransferase class I/II-fold pyridoxal phosphate-dependent enzyme [Dermatophilaceae bacterium]